MTWAEKNKNAHKSDYWLSKFEIFHEYIETYWISSSLSQPYFGLKFLISYTLAKNNVKTCVFSQRTNNFLSYNENN